MGCNCGKNGRRSYIPPAPEGTDGKYALRMADGSLRYFGSRLEADAANARAGYTGTVRRVY